MKKLLLILMMGMFLISLTSGTIETLGNFRINYAIDLVQTCANCTYNNVTNVLYPNSSLIVSGIEMTKDGSYYNCSLPANRVSELGHYIVNGIGNPDGEDTIWTYDLYVTRRGEATSTASSILYIIVLIISLFIFGLCLAGAIKLPWANARNQEGKIIDISYYKYAKTILWFLSYAVLIWIANLMVLITDSFLMLGVAFTFFRVIFFILYVGVFPIGAFTIFVIVMNWIQDRKIQKLLKRGILTK